MKVFNIGDKVEVIHTGAVYSTHEDAFTALEFVNTNRNGTKHGNIGTVFAMMWHVGNSDMMYACNSPEGQFLIGERGIRHYEEPKLRPYTFEDREEFRERWIRAKDSGNEIQVSKIHQSGVEAFGMSIVRYSELFDQWEYLDGSPFGKI